MASALPFRLSERYDVIEEIGQGGHAVVYRASDRALGRDVAVKILREDVLVPEIRARFTQEIQVLARLQHPHILRVHDSGTHGDRPFVVMELAPSQTLAHRLEREPQLPLSDAVQIARDVGGALAHAHDRAVWHRDVKPENILLGDRGAVLADFGIARVTGEMAISRITNTGEAVGTVLYMSPEQLCAEPVDARSDQYSLACVLYEMLAGVRPHTAATFEGLRALRLTARQAPVSVYRPSVSPALEEVVHRAMAVTPADRFRSMDEFLMALDLTRTGDRPISGVMPTPVSGGMPGSGPLRAEAPTAVSPARPRWLLPALVGVVVLGGAWWVTGTGARRGNADAGAGPGLLTVAIAAAVEPVADSVRARVAREVAAWSGVRVVSGPDASVQLALTTTALGDSVQLRLESRRGGRRLDVSRMLVRSALPTADATIAAMTREALAGRAASEVPGLDGLPERSLPALRAYVRGHGLLRAGQLDSAAQAFREARDTLPRFAQARFWAAQSAAWSTPRAVDRWKGDADEAVRLGTLRGVDSLLAVGLARMGAMDFVAACGAYRAATLADAGFAAEIGLSRCTRSDSLVVTGARGAEFRTSAAEALRHYRRAITLAPSGDLLAALLPEMLAGTFALGNVLRTGRSADGKTIFRALPSLSSDTLVFTPVEERLLARKGGAGVPPSWSAAVRWSRSTAMAMTSQAIERFPATPSVWLHRAYALELSERIVREDSSSAWTALDRANDSRDPRIRQSVSIARIRLAIRNADIREALLLARALVEASRPSTVDGNGGGRIAPIAAWTGDAVALVTLLERATDLPNASADSLRRFSAAIYAGDCQRARDRLPGLTAAMQTSTARAEAQSLWRSQVVPVLRRGIPCIGVPASLGNHLGADPLDSAYSALAQQDSAAVYRVLRRERESRLGAANPAISWDRLYLEGWLLTQIGKSPEATRLLLEAAENLASQSPAFLDDVVPAWGLRQGMLLLRQLLSEDATVAREHRKLVAVLNAAFLPDSTVSTGVNR